MRVYRIIEFSGEEEAVKEQLRSSLEPNRIYHFGPNLAIRIKDRPNDPCEPGFLDSCLLASTLDPPPPIPVDEKELSDLNNKITSLESKPVNKLHIAERKRIENQLYHMRQYRNYLVERQVIR